MDCDPENAASTSKVDDTVTVVRPWPYLAAIFEFLSTSAKTHRFKCLLCLPKVTVFGVSQLAVEPQKARGVGVDSACHFVKRE